MVIALTGHVKVKKALNKTTHPNIETNEEAFEILEKLIIETINNNFHDNENLVFVSGMAKGADEIFALTAIKMKKKLILCIPNKISWHKSRGADRYDEILNYENVEIKEIKKDYNGGNFYYGYFARNQAMVDLIDDDGALLAFHRYDSGGVVDTIRRAKKANKKIIEF